MAKDGLGDRCKSYENGEAGRRAMRGLPLLARLDGRAFHTFTRDLRRPYEHGMSVAMVETTRYLVQEMTALVGYTQSDEITLAWFESSQSASDYAFDGLAGRRRDEEQHHDGRRRVLLRRRARREELQRQARDAVAEGIEPPPEKNETVR